MTNKNFGVKKISIVGESGTPTIDSPNNLVINAVNVSISTDVSIGGEIDSNVIVGTGYSVGIGTTIITDPLTVKGNTSLETLNVSGIVTATGGFISAASTTPVQIDVVGSTLLFTVAGIGSTSLTLS